MFLIDELSLKIENSCANCYWHSYNNILTLTSLVVFNLHTNKCVFSSDVKEENFTYERTVKIISSNYYLRDY